jgi:gas vesicle protein
MDNERGSNGLAVALAFLLGGLVGAVISLLFAPISGRETREKIRNVSVGAKTRTVEAANKAREVTRERVTSFVDQGKARIDEAAESVIAAVEAGKAAFVHKKAEIARAVSTHGGKSDDDEPVAEMNEEARAEKTVS